MSTCTRASHFGRGLVPRAGSGATALGAPCGATRRRVAPRRQRIAPRAAAGSSPERPVFKLTSRGPEMSLDDIRDAYEVCSLIPSPNERSQCYSCWGIDSDRMADYYDAVLALEAALGRSPQPARAADPDEFQSAHTSMTD